MIIGFVFVVVVWGKLCGAEDEKYNPYIAACSLENVMAKVLVQRATDNDDQQKLFIESWHGYPFDVQKVLLAELLQQRTGFYRQFIHSRYPKADRVTAMAVAPDMSLCAVAIANTGSSYGGVLTYNMLNGARDGIKLHQLSHKLPFKQLLFYPVICQADDYSYRLAAMTSNTVYLRSITGAYSKSVLKNSKETFINMHLGYNETDIIVTSKEGTTYMIDLIKETYRFLNTKRQVSASAVESFLQLDTVIEDKGPCTLVLHNRYTQQQEYVTSRVMRSKDESCDMLPNAEGVIVKSAHTVVIYRRLRAAIANMLQDEIDCLGYGIADWLQKKAWNVSEHHVAQKFAAIQISYPLFSWLYNKQLFTYETRS